MMRRVISIVSALTCFLLVVSPVFACSGPEPTIQTMAQSAEVIASGTLDNPTADIILLRVDEYLKGQRKQLTLKLNNHHFLIADDCRLSLAAGGRFKGGEYVLVFLQNDEFKVGADWRPTGPLALYVLPIAADGQLTYGELSMGSLNDAKAEITTLSGVAISRNLPQTGTTAAGTIWLIAIGVLSLAIGFVLSRRSTWRPS